MDELYRFHSSISSSSYPNIDLTSITNSNSYNYYFHDHVVDGSTSTNNNNIENHLGYQQLHHHQYDQHNNYDHHHEVGLIMEMSDVIKAQVANHPLYPNLLSAYIDCRKVGAPAEMTSLLEEISKENHNTYSTNSSSTHEMGVDPELDEFMKSYCEVLHKYKEELSKPFDEATNFLSSIQSQFTNLCKETLPATSTLYFADDGGGAASDEDMISCGEIEAGGNQEGDRQAGDDELKEMLMRKYSGYLSSLRKEFLKKRKKGKLPKHARTALLDWWTTHYRWPYPTEEEKNVLSEITGLDQKQINNWFINQRKRHWRPSEDMRFALMEGVSGAGSMYFDPTTTEGNGGGIGST